MKNAFAIMFVLTLMLLPSYARAQNEPTLLSIDLAEDHVDITTGFNGARLVLFGMKKKDGDLAIVLKGPDKDMVVRRKSQLFGVWMNTESVTFRDVPSYYDLALSTGERRLADPALLKQMGVGLETLDFKNKGREKQDTVQRFKEALIRNKQGQGHFPLDSRDIYFLNDDFFRTNFYLPRDVPTGDYTIETFLFKDGVLLDRRDISLRVAQVGMGARVRRFAYQHEVVYGLMAVMLAVMSGGMAYYSLRKE